MRKVLILNSAMVIGLTSVMAQQAWAPAGNRIKTQWAEKVDPANPLPEYPRPQMVRPTWQNLNGLWNYAITSEKATDFKAEGKILVPFAVESSLSGVGKTVGKEKALWYERTFTVPKKWKGQNILLHFGAVDWKTDVWVNGKHVGQHTGGYTPFEYDITPYLKKKDEQTLRIRVWDATDDSFQPRGKQVECPSGIWYTPVTGIWQTVWMEPVATTRINSYTTVSDIDAKTLTVNVNTKNLQASDIVELGVEHRLDIGEHERVIVFDCKHIILECRTSPLRFST